LSSELFIVVLDYRLLPDAKDERGCRFYS